MNDNDNDNPPPSSSSLFSTASGHQLDISEEQMNRGRHILQMNDNDNDDSPVTSSFFGTASGQPLQMTTHQLEQASHLLESLAEQSEHEICAQHALPASPDSSPIQSSDKLSTERLRTEAPVAIEGPAPLKPRLPPPFPSPDPEKPLLQEVDKKQFSHRNDVAPSSKRSPTHPPSGNQKRFCPQSIQNDTDVYGNKKGVASQQRKKLDERTEAFMRKYDYTDNRSDGASSLAFNALRESLGRPRQEEYDELASTIHDSLCEEQLEVGVLNTLQASDFQFVVNKCEYEMECSFRKDREKSGIPPLILQIDHRNAEFVVYPEESDQDSLPCSFHTDETQSPQFSRLIDALVSEGAERSLLSASWVRCMWRNIIWKQASKAKWMKRVEPMKWSQVFKLLAWRYFNECYCAHPPPLKRLVQGDESDGRFIVLLVSDVVFVPPLPDYDEVPDPGTESEKKEKEPLPGRIELTDGWYFVDALLDASLTCLLQSHQIYPGLKLRIACSKMIDNDNRCAPLEMRANHPRRAHPSFFPDYQPTISQYGRVSPTTIQYEDDEGSVVPKLALQYNSTRRAVWNSYLGYTTAGVFNVNPNDCVNEGGFLPQTDLFVTRKYGLRFVEKIADTSISRTEEEEQREQAEWEASFQRVYLDVLNKLSKKWERDGEDGSLDSSQPSSNEQARSRIEEAHNREIKEAMDEALEEAGIHERDVSITGTIQVISPYRPPSSSNLSFLSDVSSLCMQSGPTIDPVIGTHKHVYDTITITFWNTSFAQMEGIKEGSAYRVTMLQARSPSRSRNGLSLVSSNSSHWEEKPDILKNESIREGVFQAWTPRRVVSLYELAQSTQDFFRQDCDMILVFLLRSDLKKRESLDAEQEPSGYYDVYFCDCCGHVLVLTVAERYASSFLNLQLCVVCHLRDIVFRGTDRVLHFQRADFNVHSRLLFAIPSQLGEVKQWMSLAREAVKQPRIESSLLQIREELQLLLKGDLSPGVHPSRLQSRQLAVGFFVDEISVEGARSPLFFRSETRLTERMRAGLVGRRGKRRSLGVAEEKRRRISMGASDVSLTSVEDSLLEEEKGVLGDSESSSVHSYCLAHKCIWDSATVVMRFCDWSRGLLVQSVVIPFSALAPYLLRVCEVDSRNGWYLMKGVSEVICKSSPDLFSGLKWSRKSSVEVASELLACYLIHSSGSCPCLPSMESNEELQSIWSELTRNLVCVLSMKDSLSSEGFAIVNELNVL